MKIRYMIFCLFLIFNSFSSWAVMSPQKNSQATHLTPEHYMGRFLFPAEETVAFYLDLFSEKTDLSRFIEKSFVPPGFSAILEGSSVQHLDFEGFLDYMFNQFVSQFPDEKFRDALMNAYYLQNQVQFFSTDGINPRLVYEKGGVVRFYISSSLKNNPLLVKYELFRLLIFHYTLNAYIQGKRPLQSNEYQMLLRVSKLLSSVFESRLFQYLSFSDLLDLFSGEREKLSSAEKSYIQLIWTRVNQSAKMKKGWVVPLFFREFEFHPRVDKHLIDSEFFSNQITYFHGLEKSARQSQDVSLLRFYRPGSLVGFSEGDKNSGSLSCKKVFGQLLN